MLKEMNQQTTTCSILSWQTRMFIDPTTVEAFVRCKWKIIQQDSREAFLCCFGEHFGVHPMMVAYLCNQVKYDIPEAGVSLEDILWT